MGVKRFKKFLQRFEVVIGKPQKAFFSSSLREVRAVWGTKKMLSEASSTNFKTAVKLFYETFNT